MNNQNAKITKGILETWFGQLGEVLPGMVTEAVKDELLLPEETDSITLKIWLQIGGATSITIQKVTGKKCPLRVPQQILDVAARKGLPLQNPYPF